MKDELVLKLLEIVKKDKFIDDNTLDDVLMNYLKQADIAYNAIVEIIRLKSPLSAAVKDIDPMENLLNETKV